MMDLTPIILELLTNNRGPNPLSPDSRTTPNYGIDATLEGNVLKMALTFHSKSSYCCMDWSCHLAMHNGKRWDSLRQKCADYGVSTPAQFTLQLSCIIEPGALFFDMSRPDRHRRGWYAFKPAEAYEYQATSTEACGMMDG